MRVSHNWLKEYVDSDLTPRDLAEALTQAGVNVAQVEKVEGARGVVVARIVTLRPHPNSDRLLVAAVSAGESGGQVVTGATNIKPGDCVPWAAPGAILPGNWAIGTTDLRGVRSEGMLLSETELLLGQPHLEDEGILVLGEDAVPGTPVTPLLGLEDHMLELDLTPNYAAHCQSMIGVAREVTVITGGKLRWPGRAATPAGPLPPGGLAGKAGTVLGTAGPNPLFSWVTVEVWDTDLCPRYTGRIISDVKIGPSPAWMRQRLQSAGIRPINNVVDVTNYVMLELGQPQHAFDYDLLRQKKVIVRRARVGEKIRTLDGVERTLEGDDLVIADPERAIGIAGVMGGEETEITASTRTIFLESAYFAGRGISRTSRRLGLRSEASGRFEKGLDPNLALVAADRAVELMELLGAGKGVPGVVDLYPNPVKPREITLRLERMNGLLGTDLTVEETASILRRLGFATELEVAGSDSLEAPTGTMEKGPRILVHVPTFRPDIEAEVDLAEEVARVYGFNRIKTTLPFGPTTSGGKDREHQLVDLARGELVSMGLDEVLTYSFIHPATFDRLRLPVDDLQRRALVLSNPLSEEQSVMRTGLLGSILEVMAYNASRKNADLAIFEIGTVYLPVEVPPTRQPEEVWRLGLGAMGNWRRKTWREPAAAGDFYYLKGVLERLLERLGLEGRFEAGQHPTFQPGRTARLLVRSKARRKAHQLVMVGWLGQVHPDVQGAYDLPGSCYLAELDFSYLLKEADLTRTYQAWTRFPAVARDLALVAPEGVPAQDIAEVIQQEGGELLESWRLFDLYQGDPVPSGYRSLAFSLTYRSTERTLTDEEVDDRQEQVLRRLQEGYGVRLR
ncbi:MAG: phenylalanine--tRNA ligase subunit beta [Firmicutes bacterium]|nr:phenylalanine--tRNA ligase subunit beta [Bacillota bacterium]MCL5038795.1 phenylalanine--tRNA ligase subunit beta [Bacillota bacterium]